MSIKPSKRLDSINEYYFSKKLKEIAEMNAAGKKIINLGIGSPDMPPSVETIETLVKAARQPHVHGYQSYIGIPALREAMADFYKKYYTVMLDPKTEILPLIGSKEGIMHVSMTYLETGDNALVPNPGYPTYRSAVTLAGAKVVNYDLDEKLGWLPNLDKLAKRNLSRTKIMWLNYPHMPTGKQATRRFFEEVVQFAKEHNLLIVNDNPYSFILNKNPMSLLEVEGWRDVAMELNSLSKSHNMAGWRVGMLAGKAEHIADVLRFKSNMDSGMFQPLQMAAVEALRAGEQWFEDLNSAYEQRRHRAEELLKILGCKFDKSQVGMFVWAKIPPQFKTGYELADKVLYEANVFITPGGIFGSRGDKFVRVSLCSTEGMFAEAMGRVKKSISIEV